MSPGLPSNDPDSTDNGVLINNPALVLLGGKCGTGARSFCFCLFFIKNLPMDDDLDAFARGITKNIKAGLRQLLESDKYNPCFYFDFLISLPHC